MLKMQRYSILFLCLFISLISEKAISANTLNPFKSKIDELECIRALNDLPKTFKKVGVSNIKITEGDINAANELLTSLSLLDTIGSWGTDTINIAETIRLIHSSKTLYNISFPVNGQMKNINLIIHESIEPLHVNNTNLLEVLGNLPEKPLSMVDYIFIAPQKEPDKGLKTLGTTIHLNTLGATVKGFHNLIIIYEISLLEGTLQHELGHTTAYHEYGTAIPDQKYHDAISADGVSVSEYPITTAENLPDSVKTYLETYGAAEDFASAMAVYISTNAGLYHPEIAKKYAHRFAILDEFMDVTPSERERITEINNSLESFNHLLEKFGLPTIDKIEIIEAIDGNLYRISNETELFLGEQTLREYLGSLKEMIDYWNENPDIRDMEILKLFERKAHSSQREKSTDIYSTENVLKRTILLSYLLNDRIKDNNIPEFIIETIHLFDTLSTSEMRRRLRIIRKAHNIFSEKFNTDEQITIKEAFQEAQTSVE